MNSQINFETRLIILEEHLSPRAIFAVERLSFLSTSFFLGTFPLHI